MKRVKRDVAWNVIDYLIKIVSYAFLILIIMTVSIAVFDTRNENEASIGNFGVTAFNDNWTLEYGDITEVISLPYDRNVESGEIVTLTKTLPDNISDGMNMMTRASVADIYIYIDGELRDEYSTDRIAGMSYYLPSANVVTSLNSKDASKEAKIVLRVKSHGHFNDVKIGYGSNVWMYTFLNSMFMNVALVLVLALGIMLLIVTVVAKNIFRDVDTAKYLALLMIDVALWVLSEASIRQFVFRRPSLSAVFAYLSMELIGAFACMYFDSIQHGKYRRRYQILECIVLIQLVINVVLHFSGVVEFYKSLTMSHIWIGLCIVVATINIVSDIIDKSVMEYHIIAFGMACFVAMSVVEIVAFYASRARVFGSFVCSGLIILMITTIVQALRDEIDHAKKREKLQQNLTNNTIETIASAIDARDEYTGGHSERVGIYAERLAREMAADYDLTEEDILRIRYIGLVHDIGKIGVADTVLNKTGKLTDEEFALMKKHTEIGYEIMSATGQSIEGLSDGIKYHHERFDGRGYPDGLCETNIPLVARILALADSYDAMTSNRIYRKRLTDEEVKAELIRCSGTQFDPALTEIFIRLIDRGELKVNTVEGMAVDEEGKIRLSSKLESRLRSDILDPNINIKNPTHVRMLCYVIKLMEKKKKSVHVLLYGPSNAKSLDAQELAKAWDTINNKVKEFVGKHDLHIRYTNESNIIALFERDDYDISMIKKELIREYPGTYVEVINVDDQDY